MNPQSIKFQEAGKSIENNELEPAIAFACTVWASWTLGKLAAVQGKNDVFALGVWRTIRQRSSWFKGRKINGVPVLSTNLRVR